MLIDIKSCNTPTFYDTYHTFMTLYCIVLTTCFYKKRVAEIKAPVTVNPFSAFLLSDCRLLCADQSISGRTGSSLYELM